MGKVTTITETDQLIAYLNRHKHPEVIVSIRLMDGAQQIFKFQYNTYYTYSYEYYPKTNKIINKIYDQFKYNIFVLKNFGDELVLYSDMNDFITEYAHIIFDGS